MPLQLGAGPQLPVITHTTDATLVVNAVNEIRLDNSLTGSHYFTPPVGTDGDVFIVLRTDAVVAAGVQVRNGGQGQQLGDGPFEIDRSSDAPITFLFLGNLWIPLHSAIRSIEVIGATSADSTARGTTVAVRNGDGTLAVADPTAATHAATKSYVDDADASAVSAAEAYADHAALAAQNAAESSAQTYIDGQIASAKSYTDTQVSSAITTAEGYTDSRYTAAITTAEDYTDTAKAAAISTAESYADALGVAAATASTIMRRDATGRAQVATPSVAADIATKGYADALGVSAATASAIMRRDANGRAQVADPSSAADIATKNYVDLTALAKAQNLNDLPDKAAGRTNLGLGNAATKNVADLWVPTTITDWNAISAPGFYFGANAANGPAAVTISAIVMGDPTNPKDLSLIATRLVSSDNPQVWFRQRRGDTATWNAWRQIYPPDSMRGSYYEEMAIGAQSIGNNAVTVISSLTQQQYASDYGGTTCFDAGGMWTCPADGPYVFTAGWEYGAGFVSGSRSGMYFLRNGGSSSTNTFLQTDIVAPGAQGRITGTAEKWMNAGDQVKFCAYQNTGATLVFQVCEGSYISIRRVASLLW